MLLAWLVEFICPFKEMDIYVYKRLSQKLTKMNIDKIIADELRSNYLNKVEKALKILGLTFSDLKNYIRVGKK